LSQLEIHWKKISDAANTDYVTTRMESTEFYYPFAKEANFIQRCCVILRNLSLVEENSKYFASHGHLVKIVLEMLHSKIDMVANYTLEILANISEHFALDGTTIEFVSWLLQLIYSKDLGAVSVVLGLLFKISSVPSNFELLAKLMDADMFKRLEELIFYAADETAVLREYSMACIINFAKYGSMRMRVQMAQQTGLIRCLIGCVTNSILGESALTALLHLAAESKNRELFLPYEEYLLQMSLSNHSLARQAGDLLVELSDI